MESRYLLILTENLSVLNIILNEFDANAEVVFGSRFKDDVSYTQVRQASGKQMRPLICCN